MCWNAPDCNPTDHAIDGRNGVAAYMPVEAPAINSVGPVAVAGLAAARNERAAAAVRPDDARADSDDTPSPFVTDESGAADTNAVNN